MLAASYFVVPEVPLVDPEVESLDDGGVVGEDGAGAVDDDGDDEYGDDDEPRGNGASSCVRLQAATKVKLRTESTTAAKVGILISYTSLERGLKKRSAGNELAGERNSPTTKIPNTIEC